MISLCDLTWCTSTSVCTIRGYEYVHARTRTRRKTARVCVLSVACRDLKQILRTYISAGRRLRCRRLGGKLNIETDRSSVHFFVSIRVGGYESHMVVLYLVPASSFLLPLAPISDHSSIGAAVKQPQALNAKWVTCSCVGCTAAVHASSWIEIQLYACCSETFWVCFG